MSPWLLAKAALSLAALAYLAWRFPFGDALAAAAGASLPWLALAVALKGAAVVASATAWHGLLDPAGRPPLRRAARTYFASLHAGLAGPGNLAGDAYRVAATGGLARADAAVAAIVGERAVSLAALAAGAAAGAWLTPLAAGWRGPLTLLALAALGALALGIGGGRALAGRVPGGGFVARAARHALLGLARLRSPPHALRALGAAALLPVLTAAATVAVFAAVGQPLDPAFALFAANAAALVVLLPVTVQGLGLREGAFVALFSGLAGVPPALAIAASLLSLAAAVLLGLAGGAALWLPARAAGPASRGADVPGLALPLLLVPLAASGYGSVGDALQKLLDLVKGLMSGLAEEMTYLPPGSAPLVMIFGGLFVLAMALVLTMLEPYFGVGQPHAHAPAARPAGAAPAAAARAATVATPAPATPASLPPLPPNLVTPPPGAGRSYDDGHAVGRALPTGDIDSVLDAAERMGLGEAHLVSVEPHRYVVRLAGCQTCRLRPGIGEGAEGCDFERGFLEGAARSVSPRASVSEAFCSRAADGACEFEIHTGG